ncbi:T-complex protein 11-domain-containing protein [Pilobolus umbonatus]|nr:T-complex protein 11-domain-containing protein [Pilobolus umbonatus]
MIKENTITEERTLHTADAPPYNDPSHADYTRETIKSTHINTSKPYFGKLSDIQIQLSTKIHNRRSSLQYKIKRNSINWITKMSSTLDTSSSHNKFSFITAVKVAWLLQKKNKKSTFNRRLSFSVQIKEEPPVYKPSEKLHPAIVATMEHPPITAESLKELSVFSLCKCLQIRHDLLVDPNLSFKPRTISKKHENAKLYWEHLDMLIKKFMLDYQTGAKMSAQLERILINLFKELSAILVSLINPFPPQISASFVWHWPSFVTEPVILNLLNPEKIMKGLALGTFDIDCTFKFLYGIIGPICPEPAKEMAKLVTLKEYTMALELCFVVLEMIKLDCANKTLHYLRPYLIETGIRMEWRVFSQRIRDEEIDLSSIRDWLAITWKQMGPATSFIDVYRAAFVNLVTNTRGCVPDDELHPDIFPVSLQYDEKRLKNQMAHEFQNVIVIALLMMPYRIIAGHKAKRKDLMKLKERYADILNEASISNKRVPCLYLATQACKMANKLIMEKKADNDFIIKQSKYWSSWISHNLRSESAVYKLLHKRIRGNMIKVLAYRPEKGDEHVDKLYTFVQGFRDHVTIGLDEEIIQLGTKLLVVANYNLRIFGSLYTHMVPCIRGHVHNV